MRDDLPKPAIPRLSLRLAQAAVRAEGARLAITDLIVEIEDDSVTPPGAVALLEQARGIIDQAVRELLMVRS